MSDVRFTDLVKSLFPGAALKHEVRLTGGVSADVHRLELILADGGETSVVLRAHGASHSGHPAELEYQLLQALRRAGLPVPEPLMVDASQSLLPEPFLVIAFVEGTSTITTGLEGRHIDLMAHALTKIHGSPTSGLPRLPERNDPLPEVFEYLPESPEWQDLKAHLRSLNDTGYVQAPKLLHGDFWPENLLWHEGAIAAILDWEDAALGDPLSDVAAARVELRYKYGKDVMRRFTEAYAGHQAVDLRRLALWQVYVAAAAHHFMGAWGLDPTLEAHMRKEALACIKEAGDELMGRDVTRRMRPATRSE